jgi:hypothetical protein
MIVGIMATIPDKNLSVLREAVTTVLDFSASELTDIDTLAVKLRAIIEAAKERQQAELRKTL